MNARQMALDALKKCLDEFDPEHDGTDFESECTECWAAKQAREAIAALEADIAQAVEPVAWISQNSMRRLRKGGNDSKGTVPVHASRTYVSKVALFTTPPESAVNAQDQQDAQRYRYLRDSKTLDQWIWDALEHTEDDYYCRGLDASIDAAIAKASA